MILHSAILLIQLKVYFVILRQIFFKNWHERGGELLIMSVILASLSLDKIFTKFWTEFPAPAQ